jgi:FkbM family methyltransferase
MTGFTERITIATRRAVRPQSYVGLATRPIDALKWREIDKRIKQYMGNVASMQVLQIGANDGRHADPINTYIQQFGWGGVLVEPIPAQFERLKETYDNNSGLQFINAAITDHDGSVTMYSAVDQNGALQGKDSLDPRVLSKHMWLVPESENTDIGEVVVPAMTFHTLLGTTGIAAIDMLVVDTEGHDAVIMEQVLSEPGLPRIPYIMFEHCHLSSLERKRLMGTLHERGYKTTKLRRDTFAEDQMLG